MAKRLREAPIRPADRSLRVLHVTASLSPHYGGPTAAVLAMARGLVADGVHVTIYAPDLLHRPGWWSAEATTLGDHGPIVPTGVNVELFPTSWPHRYGFAPTLAARLRDTASTFDVIHIHSIYRFSTVAAARSAIAASVPFLVRPHGTLLPYLFERGALARRTYLRFVERRYLDRAAAIHFTSEEEMVRSRAVGLRAPGLVIPLGIDQDDIDLPGSRDRFLESHPELSGKRLLVTVARIAPQKGIDILSDAFTGLAKVHPDLHLVIAGPDDVGFAADVSRNLDRAGLTDRVTWLGLVAGQEKRDLLEATTVWALPSRAENFGMAVVEAMGRGLPVVISDQVNIHSEVAAAGAGLVTACNANDIAQAIDRVLVDSGLGTRLGFAGRTLVRSHYTHETVARELKRVYTDLSDNRRRDLAWP